MPPDEPEVRVRPATVDDADALGVFHVASWRSAYAGMIPDAVLTGLDEAARAGRWREALAGRSDIRTLLAERGGEVVGLVSAGPPLAEASAGTAWLYALYVAAPLWGTGVGYRLHEAGLELMRAAGFSRAELWVLRDNQRAIVFYERHGWTRDGREQVDRHLPGAELEEIGLSRAL